MEHRIRSAMINGKIDLLLKGEVEVDETYIGGKEKNKHWNKRIKGAHGSVGKIIVFGIIGRDGKFYAEVVPDKDRKTLLPIISKKVEPGSIVNTDGAPQYEELDSLGYNRKTVVHSKKEYVRTEADGSKVYTNGIESAWALLKRNIYGVWYKVSAKHLQRYVDEFSFRWNGRIIGNYNMDIIDSLISGCWGQTLPYKVLIA